MGGLHIIKPSKRIFEIANKLNMQKTVGSVVEIIDLPQLPLEIKQAINSKKLAIFIGAGVSRLIGCDSWDTLAKKLVEECAKNHYIEPITNDILL